MEEPDEMAGSDPQPDKETVLKGEKSNPDQVIIGGGGRMPRFYLTYHSETMNRPAKIKMEINYVDKTLYPHQTMELKSYITVLDNKELQLLYKQPYQNYTTPITIECYDPREIYTEKARAALTRIKYKLRDIIDIHMLQQQYNYTINEYKPQIIEKTVFILDLYRKYQENIETKTLPKTGDMIQEELQLLTIEPPLDLEQNIQRIHKEIEDIRKELRERKF